MNVPRRPVNLGDLLSDIEDSGFSIVSLIVDHNGISDFYDSEDVEFVDSELYERRVTMFEVTNYTKRKVSVHIVLEGE